MVALLEPYNNIIRDIQGNTDGSNPGGGGEGKFLSFLEGLHSRFNSGTSLGKISGPERT